MHEFNNRIELQREVLQIINQKKFDFELTGLSDGAIKRWLSDNKFNNDSESIKIIFKIASKLFFLANKSQEQITNAYRKLSIEVTELIDALRIKINNLN
ncbi:hypothetical protein FF125_09515 [Aureibaculum algae]|uniref:Uncharacterized protein n=1 Tax=Aureibaculum algae TaxID=2584122 RepID=A0A5B7TQZ3_9FLAO|nr:hypothetical protein [Aureibaculum algae]QCX38658.1 hypothetical protein FF125_09515 [Aureibaculum algae]